MKQAYDHNLVKKNLALWMYWDDLGIESDDRYDASAQIIECFRKIDARSSKELAQDNVMLGQLNYFFQCQANTPCNREAYKNYLVVSGQYVAAKARKLNFVPIGTDHLDAGYDDVPLFKPVPHKPQPSNIDMVLHPQKTEIVHSCNSAFGLYKPSGKQWVSTVRTQSATNVLSLPDKEKEAPLPKGGGEGRWKEVVSSSLDGINRGWDGYTFG